MQTLVVLPTFDEAENIDEVLRRVRAALPDATVLIVDDGSPDGTADIAEALADELGPLEVLRRPKKSGLGSAYREGFRIGIERGFDALVEMDSDLSHDPAALPSLLAPLDDDADIGLVVGSRYIPGGSIPHWSLHRRMLSEWGNRYAALMLGLKVRDSTSGFRAYRAAAVAKIDLEQIRADGYGFQIEMAYMIARSGWRVGVRRRVRIPFSPRGGRSPSPRFRPASPHRAHRRGRPPFHPHLARRQRGEGQRRSESRKPGRIEIGGERHRLRLVPVARKHDRRAAAGVHAHRGRSPEVRGRAVHGDVGARRIARNRELDRPLRSEAHADLVGSRGGVHAQFPGAAPGGGPHGLGPPPGEMRSPLRVGGFLPSMYTGATGCSPVPGSEMPMLACLLRPAR